MHCDADSVLRRCRPQMYVFFPFRFNPAYSLVLTFSSCVNKVSKVLCRATSGHVECRKTLEDQRRMTTINVDNNIS